MHTRVLLRSLAAPAAGALLALAASPGAAAVPVAQASASGAVLNVGGQMQDTGTYRVSHDGTTETSSGSNQPALQVLGGQFAGNVGGLAQDATTWLVDGKGHSAACAGLGGDGSTALQVGDGACLTGGNNLSLDAGALDLSGLELIDNDQLASAAAPLTGALEPVLDQILGELQAGGEQVLAALDNPGLYLDGGVIESRCTAGPGTAQGTATLADFAGYASFMGQRIELIRLPADPAPNTEIVTGLDQVVGLILDSVETQLTTLVDGILGAGGDDPLDGTPLGDILDQLPTGGTPVEQLPIADLIAMLEDGAGGVGPGQAEQAISQLEDLAQLPGALHRAAAPTGSEIRTSAERNPVTDTLTQVFDEIGAALVDTALADLAAQLAPLEENLLRGVLNKQVRPTEDSIEVTALELELLPAAREFGMTAVKAEVAKSTCGPSGALRATASPTPTPGEEPKAPAPSGPPPAVPTSVPAGLASAPIDGGGLGNGGTLALGALLVIGVGAGVAAYRRSLGR